VLAQGQIVDQVARTLAVLGTALGDRRRWLVSNSRALVRNSNKAATSLSSTRGGMIVK